MLAVFRLFPWLTMLSLITSCNRAAAPSTSPAAAAYTDGFEIVVFEMREGAPINARSLHLKEAEDAIASGSHALIPGDPASLQRQLSTGHRGDSKVQVSVLPLSERKQQVRLSFHESSRTYMYQYVVDGERVLPQSSEYRDLSKSKTVRYAQP